MNAEYLLPFAVDASDDNKGGKRKERVNYRLNQHAELPI